MNYFLQYVCVDKLRNGDDYYIPPRGWKYLKGGKLLYNITPRRMLVQYLYLDDHCSVTDNILEIRHPIQDHRVYGIVLCLNHSSRNRVDATVILHFVQSLRKFLNQGQGTAWLIATHDIRSQFKIAIVYFSHQFVNKSFVETYAQRHNTRFFSINIKNSFGSKKLYSVCTVRSPESSKKSFPYLFVLSLLIFPTILSSAFIYTNNGAMYPINIQSSRKAFQ